VARIAHLDVDAFYASVELLRRPELRGKPVIVSGSGPRAVVTTASYEARAFGVGSAMPTSRARRLCPQAILIPPDFEAYRSVSKVVMGLVRGTVETVEVLGLDEAYLDLDGLMAPRAAMRRLVTEIREATGLDASVGIGPNRLVAKVASDAEKPRGFVVLSREDACARFASSPPGLVPGIGPKTVARLQRLGVTTLGQLGSMPLDTLRTAFGANHAEHLQRAARFEGSTTVVPVREAVSESRETTFDVDIADPEEMERRLRELAGDLCRRLGEKGIRGRTIAIKVRLDDFTTVTRARTLPDATNDVAVVADVAATLLRGYAPPRPVRLLGVRVAAFARGEEGEPREDPQLALDVGA
jgi:DNA polymerase IV